MSENTIRKIPKKNIVILCIVLLVTVPIMYFLHDRKHLEVRDFYEFKMGETTYAEVIEEIGEPHDIEGSGFIQGVYYTEDGYVVRVYYERDVIDTIFIKCPNGVYYTRE